MKKKITGIFVCIMVIAVTSLLVAGTAILRPDKQTAVSLRGAKKTANYRPVEAVAEQILAGPVDRTKDLCDLYGTPYWIYSDWFYGQEWYANYQDPEEFGCLAVWPFRVTEICFDMNIAASLTFDVQGFVLENVGTPSCPFPGSTLPGEPLCTTRVYNIQLPGAGHKHICLPMTERCCVNEPYFAAIYIYTDFTSMTDPPDPLSEDDPTDICRSYNDWGSGWEDLVVDLDWDGEMILNSIGYTTPQNDCPKEFDFGDAPDPHYPTLLNNGARHNIVPNRFLGADIDAEANGQPSADALGDDEDGNDDEDGVVFLSLANPGPVDAKVTASTNGFLDAWVDFNVDGDWGDPGENIFANEPLVAGANILTFNVPGTAPAGITYSRFRFSTAGDLSYTGLAWDGEVEDYRVFVQDSIEHVKMHWPQWPDLDSTGMDICMHTTILGDDWMCTQTGPVTDIHFWGSFMDDDVQGGMTFQVSIWSDNPGPPSTPADQLWSRYFSPGTYTVHQKADNNPEDYYMPVDGIWYDDNHLQVYQYDFLIDQDFFVQDSGTVYWLVVGIMFSGSYWFGWKTTEYDLRYRDDACYWAGLNWMPLFYPPGHEYEDETIDLAFAITGADLDFGDAPDPDYPTLFANDGANHIIVPNVFLGAGIDAEADGLPDADALGDDNDGNDDEDGVVFTSLTVAGNPVTVKVTASVAGFLDAWVDFNVDGYWGDPGENIFASEPLAAGVNNLTFNVPATTPAGITYSRFRFSTAGGLNYTGLAPDGEVEDYRVFVQDSIEYVKMHHPQWPDLDNTGMDLGMHIASIGDDWMCTQTGPVTDIHFWASFIGDDVPWPGPEFVDFLVSIWSDNPGPPSTPDNKLWERYFGHLGYSFTVHQVADNNPEDWYDPAIDLWLNNDHLQAYQYDLLIDQDYFVQDSGMVYWLVIDGTMILGWKTTEYDLRYRDDACYYYGGNWVPITYPEGHEYEYETLDLAFAITGKGLCGDVNHDWVVDLGDVLYLISYLYKGGLAPDPLAVGDVDCDGTAELGDVLYMISYLYKGGFDPCDPDGDGIPDC